MAGLNAGARLGVYEIVGPLGQGGMGQVYRALDTRLNRPVAIKVVGEEFAERFNREARAISSLNHPHICTLYDVGPNYLVMELVDGETLADRLKGSPLPANLVVQLGAQIAQALAAAHRKGVVHRDLKPANIMLTRTGIKVLDFGVAQLDAFPGDTATISRVVAGTPAYMAPEQIEGGVTDARTDIFAFGLILAEMVTGTRPVNRPPLLPPQTPPHLVQVIERCVAADPDERWQAAADIGWELTSGDRRAPAARSSRKHWIWAAPVAAALMGIAVGQRVFRPPAAVTQDPLHFTIGPPSAARFEVDLGVVFPAVSPDGRTLAFVANDGGGTRLWLRPLEAAAPHALDGTEGVMHVPFWSPDSRSIAFFADGKLKRVDAAGGPPQTLCSVTTNAHSGSWNANGQLLFGDGSVGPEGGIFAIPAGGGEVRRVAGPDPSQKEDSVFWPEFLPDGDRYLYMSGVKGFTGNRVYVRSLSKSTSTFLLKANSRVMYAAPGFLLYLRDRTLLAHRFNPQAATLVDDVSPIAEHVDVFSPIGIAAMSVSRTGVLAYHAGDRTSRLVWVTRAGGETATVGPVADYATMRLSPDGQRLAIDLIDSRTNATDLHLFELARQTDTRLTSAPGAEFGPLWSPDGRRIVFSWDKDAPPYLFQMALDDTTTAPLMRPNGEVQTADDWHPDGTIIYDLTRAATRNDLWTMPATGDRTAKPFLQTPFNEFGARFSPDGRWVAYVSDETGRNEIYVRPFPGPGEARRLSVAGGVLPRWRRDGKELFFVENERLMSVSTTLTPGFTAGAPVQLFDRRPAQIIDFDVTRDGRSFLINSEVAGPGTTPMDIVINWTATLKKP